jgi:endonuclease/exonuclease/phosphatase family metal-dependent hydrolase
MTRPTTGLRVATYNLYLGADLALLFAVTDLDELAAQVQVVRDQLDATRYDERAQAVAALLARERPDVVGLQEVSRWTRAPLGPDGRPGAQQVLVDFLPTLTAALERSGCGYDVHAVSRSFEGAMPVSDREWMGLVGANAVLVRRDSPVTVLDETVATYATGLEVATGIAGVTFPIVRSWGRVDLDVDGRPVRFVNTHTEAYDASARDAQRDELLVATVRADVEGAVVVVGDFNAAPDAVGMPAGWTDAWAAGEGPGYTCGQHADLANATSSLSERIDYVWVRGTSVRHSRVVGDRPEDRSVPHGLWPSDHACVIADLEL